MHLSRLHFAYMLAHDAKDSLRAIMLQTELLRDLCDEDALPLLDRIMAEADLANRMVSALYKDAFPGEDLAATVMELLDVPHDFTIEWALEPGQAPDGELRFVLRNLIANAIKHHPGGGTVQVCQSDDLFEIRDDGRGFTWQDVEQSDRYGLRIVRDLVEARGGALHIETPASGGAAIALHWPAHGKPRTPGHVAVEQEVMRS